MEFNGVLVANPGAASGILNKVNWVEFYYQDSQEPVKEPISLKDWDKYRIVFLNNDGKPQNKWTEKYWYWKDFFKKFEIDKNGNKRFEIEQKKNDKDSPLLLTLKKIK
jgi:hypothetical protein